MNLVSELASEAVPALARWLSGAGLRLTNNVTGIETIFLLSVFAEIYVTTSGGPGLASTNLAFLIYLRALREYDVGGASAAGVIAVILANIVAIFLVRSIAKNIAD